LTFGKFLFKNRGYMPIPFFITAVIFANPRQDLMVFGAILMLAGELLGNLLLYMGASIFSGALLPYLFYLTIFFFLLFYALIVRYEESNLVSVFGNKYEKYIINVPRFFPRLSAYPDKSESKADFGEAMNAEKSTLVTILGFVALIVINWYIKS